MTANQVLPLRWRSDKPDFDAYTQPMLCYGLGRSYGDSCLNDKGILIDTSYLGRYISFDDQRGILRCEAGVSLADILKLIVPRGWFLPVTPGTKFVTVAGAIANDVHGKNHHRSGNFGCHVTCFELLRSNGERLLCSPEHNKEFFSATIGGMGLTGIILWAEFLLKKIANPYIDKESIKLTDLKEFFEVAADSDKKFEYTVAWIDCLAKGKKIGRGHFYRGNHAGPEITRKFRYKTEGFKPFVPLDMPSILLNSLSMRAFNSTYYHSQAAKHTRKLVSYDPFFYPLDFLESWNRMYGKRGFLQYQCAVPPAQEHEVIKELLGRVSLAGAGSFLVVLKKFGEVASPGMMSFPMPGSTLAMDFPYKGEKTLILLDELDRVVQGCGGRVYPAKDARMSASSFQNYYPQWEKFSKYIDPKFSSSFWRRVTGAFQR